MKHYQDTDELHGNGKAFPKTNTYGLVPITHSRSSRFIPSAAIPCRPNSRDRMSKKKRITVRDLQLLESGRTMSRKDSRLNRMGRLDGN